MVEANISAQPAVPSGAKQISTSGANEEGHSEPEEQKRKEPNEDETIENPIVVIVVENRTEDELRDWKEPKQKNKAHSPCSLISLPCDEVRISVFVQFHAHNIHVDQNIVAKCSGKPVYPLDRVSRSLTTRAPMDNAYERFPRILPIVMPAVN